MPRFQMVSARAGWHFVGSVAPAATALGLLAGQSVPAEAANITKEPYGTLADGRAVEIYTMTAARGMSVRFLSYGGVITEMNVPDRSNRVGNVVLGFSSLADYVDKSGGGGIYFGALIGRYANRIAKGRFTLDGRTYSLAVNNGPNALHGGIEGFDKQIWEVEPASRGARRQCHALLHQQGRRGRLSRHALRAGHLHPDRRQ